MDYSTPLTMNYLSRILLSLSLLCVFTAQAQLAVTVSRPKIIGQKAVVTLAMKNDFNESVKFARASCFLLDAQGTMVAQSAKWVINVNQNKTGLPAGGTNEFNFVITGSEPFATTNLTAKINFSRIVLESGAVADVNKSVTVTTR
jgi:hypothetical protein